MIWFFERDGERLRYEIRRADAGDAYELTVTLQDGRADVEQVIEAADLLARCMDRGEALKREGWRAARLMPAAF